MILKLVSIKFLPLLIVSLFILTFPVDIFAAKVGPGGFLTCEGAGCNTCHLVELAKNILKWLIGVMLVIFTILVAVAGFQLVTSGGNPEAKTNAKKKVMNAFIGIVIVLCAWLLVDTLMRALLAGGKGEIGTWGIWSKMQCTTNAPISVSPSGAGGSGKPAAIK